MFNCLTFPKLSQNINNGGQFLSCFMQLKILIIDFQLNVSSWPGVSCEDSGQKVGAVVVTQAEKFPIIPRILTVKSPEL